jgi:hypothetical protein
MDTRRTTTTTTAPALLGRLLWMMVGPISLALLALSIAQRRAGWLSAQSLAYFPVLAVMLFGRWLEFRCGQPMTSTGEPATAADLRRYLLVAGALGLATWIVANLPGIVG